MTLLDQYQAILLDMNSTFMFGEDRFAEAEDFYATYRQVGGKVLSATAVEAALRACYSGMLRDYEDPHKYDDFPSLPEGLLQYGGIDKRHVDHLSAVFARHEIGTVPPRHAAVLRHWSRTHHLGVVSNIWAEKTPWLREFERMGIRDIWHSMVFSSDSRSIKPSLALFDQALQTLAVPADKVLFIGDSLRVDMAPAKALGMDTLWLNEAKQAHPLADYVAHSLLEIESLVPV